MKNILLMLFLCTCVSCNNNPEYKGIVINKEKVVITSYVVTIPSKAIINVMPIYSDGYILTVKDSINNKKKYYVNKKTYDELNIGDKYIN